MVELTGLLKVADTNYVSILELNFSFPPTSSLVVAHVIGIICNVTCIT